MMTDEFIEHLYEGSPDHGKGQGKGANAGAAKEDTDGAREAA